MDNRYYFEKQQGDICFIEGQEFVHLIKVRRTSLGDKIVGFNGDGYDYDLTVTNISKNIAECRIENKTKNLSLERPNLTIYLASLKSDALSDALDGLTQLNVGEIVVFDSQYTQVKYDDKKIEELKTHFIQASKQCERAGYCYRP